MSTVVPLSEGFNAEALRRLAKAGRDAGRSRRILSLATIYDGGSNTDAARIGVVGLQMVRDRILERLTERHHER